MDSLHLRFCSISLLLSHDVRSSGLGISCWLLPLCYLLLVLLGANYQSCCCALCCCSFCTVRCYCCCVSHFCSWCSRFRHCCCCWCCCCVVRCRCCCCVNCICCGFAGCVVGMILALSRLNKLIKREGTNRSVSVLMPLLYHFCRAGTFAVGLADITAPFSFPPFFVPCFRLRICAFVYV